MSDELHKALSLRGFIRETGEGVTDPRWSLKVNDLQSIEVTALSEKTLAEPHQPPRKPFRIARLIDGRENRDVEVDTMSEVVETVETWHHDMQNDYVRAKVKSDRETRDRQGKSELLRLYYIRGRHRVRITFRDDGGTAPLLFVRQNDVSVILRLSEEQPEREYFWDDIRCVELENAK